MTTLITGAAGFIGYHVAKQLCTRHEHVIGIDNLNDYYDVNLKKARLAQLENFKHFQFFKLDITNAEDMHELFKKYSIKKVIHLAAQAGVRYSIQNPAVYVNSNLVGFSNILEACRYAKVEHLTYASSSSVYGANTNLPFSIHDNVDHPLSLYAATKKSNELMAHAYSHLYQIPTTGLRFFTVYGPWGRPDMALFLFTQKILKQEPIDVFNFGNHRRDFTYIDDIVDGVIRVHDQSAEKAPNWNGNHPDPGASFAPWRVYNIGNNRPVCLLDYIALLESFLGKKAIINFLPLQLGDVPETWADIDALQHAVGYSPATSVDRGIKLFVDWYIKYYAGAIRAKEEQVYG